MRKTSHRLKVQLQDGGTTNERLQVEEDGLRYYTRKVGGLISG